MPITGNASYIPTTNAFLTHWTQVNAVLPVAQPLILSSGVTRAALVTLRDGLQDFFDGVQDKLNDVEIGAGVLLLKKQALLGRLNQFNAVIEGYFGGSALAGARPLAPSIGDSEEVFVEPLRDMKSLWVKLNAAVAPPGLALPLVLDGGLTRADFVTAVGELTTAYEGVQTAEQNLKLERLLRDQRKDLIYAALKLYRLAVPARVPNNSALLETLPKLTPEPGHTPDAVNASAVLVPPNQFKVVFEASTDADLKEYQLRGNAGGSFKSEDAVVIATVAKEASREVLSGFGLNQPGAKVSLVLYVITNAGNERGSAPMLVTRPNV